MSDLSNQLNDIISKINLRVNDFDFKHGQIEKDMKTIDSLLSNNSSDKGKAFLYQMQAACDQYRDAIDSLRIAAQRLTVLSWKV